jgi:hypothetical protein
MDREYIKTVVPETTKREPKFSDITSVPLADLGDSATVEEERLQEAQGILYEWSKVATYWLSRRQVEAMLRARADDLGRD